MFDPENDHLVPIRLCRPFFSSAFKDGSISDRTIRRWIGHGRNGVRLASVKIGGIRYTSLEAIRKFVRASAANETEAFPGKPREPRASGGHRARTAPSPASRRLDDMKF